MNRLFRLFHAANIFRHQTIYLHDLYLTPCEGKNPVTAGLF